MIKAIQTRYAGYLFRSRLEARWAVFFDALKLDWQYEPEGFDLPSGQKYLPDFKIKSKFHETLLWVEVKPLGIDCEKTISDFMDASPSEWRCTILHDIPDPRFISQTGHYWNGRENDDLPYIWFGGGEEGKHGWDNYYRFCICESCGVAGFTFDGRSARIGCKCDIHYASDKNYTPNHPIIISAFAKARAARFEHEYREDYLTV